MATQEEVDAFLAHHGVLGMHWGVRKAESNEEEGRGSQPTKSSSSSSSTAKLAVSSTASIRAKETKDLAGRIKNLSPRDTEVLKKVGASPADSELYEQKYGVNPPTEKKGLTPAQKRVLVYGALGVGVGLAALAVYNNKSAGNHAADLLKDAANKAEWDEIDKKVKDDAVKEYVDRYGVSQHLAEFVTDGAQHKASQLSGVKDISQLGTSDLSFEKGHVFSRVSTEAEKAVKSSGFYASTSPEDTERYKATLPVFWKTWPSTRGKTSGFVIHHVADTDVKIASEKKLYDLINSSLKDSIKDNLGNTKTIEDHLKQTYGRNSVEESTETLLKRSYYDLVTNFVDTNDPVTRNLTEKLKVAGYHGIIDSNDAGSLSKTPVKFIDGSIFKIIGHDDLSAEAIKAAQDSIQALVHILSQLSKGMNGMIGQDVDEFLAHFGVKGMHWGVRHARADAHEYVKAKLAIGEGAGNRRKLIKAKVAARAKKSPEYQRAFEEHVNKYSEHTDRLARQAVVNKNVKATSKSVAKTARGVHRSLTGGFGNVSLASAAIAGAAVYAHKTGLDKKLMAEAQKAYNNSKKVDYSEVASWLKAQGVG